MTRGLARWLLVCAALQLLCAVVLGGRLHPDEVHQWIEPASRWVDGYGTISNEWYLGMRNVLGPGLVAGVLALCRALHLRGPALTLGVLHVGTALASLRALRGRLQRLRLLQAVDALIAGVQLLADRRHGRPLRHVRPE